MRNKKVKKRNKNQENKDLSHFFKTLIIRVLFFYLHFFLFLLELEQQLFRCHKKRKKVRNKKVKKRNKNQENKDLSHFFKTLIIRVLFFYLHFFLFLLELEQS